MERFAVLGAGSWGTILAGILAEKGYKTALWARSPELCAQISGLKENPLYLPGIKLPGSLLPTPSLKEALEGVTLIVCAIPSHGIRAVFTEARAFVPKGSIIVSASKGIEEGTHLTACGILRDTLKGVPIKDVVALSGPSFAKEVGMKLPAAVCAASPSIEAATAVQKAFSAPHFRVYTNTDITGVELGGALKNVIAIASGISDGLSLGNNARAALITRGLAEISRLGIKMGANPLTFAGLSGLGDLVLTCTAPLSRNYSVGVEIGKGRSLEEITKGMRMVAEGVRTSKAVLSLSKIQGIDMPITEAVCNVLYEGKSPRETVYELMMRQLKGE